MYKRQAVIILSLFVVTLSYTTINLIRKNEDLTDQVLDSYDVIKNSYQKFGEALEDMRAIDSKGGFESDDEVGAVFDGLKDVLTKLESEIKNAE